MVRFSDMLGGNGDPERARPATAPDPVPTDAIPEPNPTPSNLPFTWTNRCRFSRRISV